ncbi:hypothetical protein, variant 1 [Allomyces macrogynus ATCC 38327]|nr:hypothetical protein, variant 2 [Allomyces macrogynus ATCC 38327]KNE66278.1 hypothetical protein, variant 1 [Allomyces macrogynus ATCC 38327]|eukprot:KNE66277.1 hypothetical protein, variant 2 [Allomyces macrogynus ATCC 38327]
MSLVALVASTTRARAATAAASRTALIRRGVRMYTTEAPVQPAAAEAPRPSKWARRLKWTAYAAGAVAVVGGVLAYRHHPMPQQEPDPTKKTLLVLGTGWGAISLLRRLDTSEYNTIVVSPTNFFLFTPLLPSVTTGSLESRSIITPIKYFLRFKPFGIKFVEAESTQIDPASKTVEILDSGEVHGAITKTRLPYDYLVIGVGAESQTFGIKGVREFGLFLKEIRDARKIRTRLMDCIETAAFPGQPDDEIRRLLHMVVVGGGPTGVEYAGELHDFLRGEVDKWYPEIAPHLKITLIEALPHVLPMFSREMIEYTEKSFADMNIDLLANTAVQEVRAKELVVKDTKSGATREVPYGMLVWATGNTMRPVIKDLQARFADKGQSNRRGLVVDEYLRVAGMPDVWALGDCTATAFAPTAQVAAQQGTYLARQLNDLARTNRTGNDILATCPPFDYKHRATLAYIGDERGVSDVSLPFWSNMVSFAGYQSYLFWRSAYLSNLYTLRNRALVAFDWTKEKLFGRDISRE